MKKLFLNSLVLSLFLMSDVNARTVDIEVHGMTCAFCVDSLERQFKKMSAVSQVKVSLKQKKVRLETDSDKPSLEKIKQTILDVGFMPVKINIIDK